MPGRSAQSLCVFHWCTCDRTLPEWTHLAWAETASLNVKPCLWPGRETDTDDPEAAQGKEERRGAQGQFTYKLHILLLYDQSKNEPATTHPTEENLDIDEISFLNIFYCVLPDMT